MLSYFKTLFPCPPKVVTLDKGWKVAPEPRICHNSRAKQEASFRETVTPRVREISNCIKSAK